VNRSETARMEQMVRQLAEAFATASNMLEEARATHEERYCDKPECDVGHVHFHVDQG